jgi:hypothetical protein
MVKRGKQSNPKPGPPGAPTARSLDCLEPGPLEPWPPGPAWSLDRRLEPWPPGALTAWSPDRLEPGPSGALTAWSPGRLEPGPSGALTAWSPECLEPWPPGVRLELFREASPSLPRTGVDDLKTRERREHRDHRCPDNPAYKQGTPTFRATTGSSTYVARNVGLSLNKLLILIVSLLIVS